MGGPRPFGIWAYGVPWGYISGDLLLRFRGDEATLRWVFIVSDTLAWTRTCKNKLYLQILQSHRDHYVVPLGCTGHASVHHRSAFISAVRPTIESARLPPRMLGCLGGMTHARESSLSSLASCSRPSSPPTYPHRLRPRVGQPASLTSRHRAHFGPSARCASMQGSQRPSAVTSAEPLESTPLPPEI